MVDAVGAGDALLAYATLSLVATKSNVIGSILGALAAAVACEHDGNNPVDARGRSARSSTRSKSARATNENRGRRPRNARAQAPRDRRRSRRRHGRSGRGRRRFSSASRTSRSASYDAACVCVPDQEKFAILRHLLAQRKTRAGREAAARSTRRNPRVDRTLPSQTRRLLHRLQPPLRAAHRASSSRFSTPDVSARSISQNSSTATAPRATSATRRGATRASAFSPISARTCSTWRIFFSARTVNRASCGARIASRTRRPTTSSSVIAASRVLEMEATLLSWRNTFQPRSFRRTRQRAHRLPVQVGTEHAHGAQARPAERPSGRNRRDARTARPDVAARVRSLPRALPDRRDQPRQRHLDF